MAEARWRVPRPENLLDELVVLQNEHGYLRDDDLLALSRRRHAPLHEIQGLISFYPVFRRAPPPAFHVRACRDLACHMRGAASALSALAEHCAGRDDVEVEPASCLGRCDLAPACTVNEVPIEASRVREALQAPEPLASVGAPKPSRAATRWKLDPHANEDEHYAVLREWLEARTEETAASLAKRLSDADLRGMGGAGFPTGRKWALVASAPSPHRYVICNADESEPGTFKDRVVLEELPHLIIEGMVLAGLAIGSHEGVVYIRHEYGPERRVLERALERARDVGALGERVFGSDFAFDIRIFVSPGGYVLGEETALLEALEGRRGEPRNKPPYPGVRGLHGQPTLINNVETFAQVPRSLRTGRADLKLFSVSGDVRRPAVIEAPLGTTVTELIDACGGMRADAPLLAFLPGGASTGFLFAEHASLPLDWASLAAAGSSLGSAAVLVVAEGADLEDLAGNLTAFFRNESCGKCVPCRIGTEKALQLIESGAADAHALLAALHETLRATSICGLGQAALVPILSVLDRKRPREARTP